MRRERTERVHGPYKHGRKWRVVVTRADRSQTVESFEDKGEAQRVADAARTQSQGRTLTFALDAYEMSLRERSLANVSIERQRAHLEKLLNVKKNGHRFLPWLTVKRADALYTALRTSTTRLHRPIAVDTHRNALKVGKSFGRWAAKLGWLPADPFAAVDGVGRRRRGKPQLHLDEVRRLIEVCRRERSRDSIAVGTGFLLGFGASEVVGRQVRDLDDGGRRLIVTKGKNAYRVRTVEVPDDWQPLLVELAGRRPGAAYLFGETDLERPTRHWLLYHCKRLCKAARVPIVTPHGLRGTHSTIAMGAVATSHHVAAAIAAAGASLGHASGSAITQSTYIAPGTVEAATQRAAMRVLKGGR